MKIGIIGLGRVFNHYLNNFIDKEFLKKEVNFKINFYAILVRLLKI